MRILWIILLFFICSVLLVAGTNVKVGAHAGYFSPKDSTVNDIYPKKSITYGAKLGVKIWNGFFIWLSGMHYQANGKTTLLQDDTKLTLNPVTLSLRYTFPLGKINPYISGGYTYLFYKERSAIGNTSGNEQGYTLEAGIELALARRIALELGASYSDLKADPNGFDINLGGFQAGVTFLFLF